MRAQLVYENLNFERGQDPKRSMGIGNEDARIMNGVEKEAKRIGLVRAPEVVAKKFGLGDEEPFDDMMMWNLPEDDKTGIILFKYIGDEHEQPYKVTENDYILLSAKDGIEINQWEGLPNVLSTLKNAGSFSELV